MLSESEQPLASVTTTEYISSEDVVARGLAILSASKLAEGVHAYEYPPPPPLAVGEPPMVTLLPLQTSLSGPASAVGRALTVTCTSSISEQPLASVTVTV